MYKKKQRIGYKSYVRKKRLIITGIVIVLSGFIVATGIYLIIKFWDSVRGEKRELLQLWDNGSYNEVYEQSLAHLGSRPLDYFLLTMHGFSAYQMGISQINNQDASVYFDDCINKLRKAMHLPNAENDGRIFYVLGKAYSYKGESYADLEIKYLEKARKMPYYADDIPEYLGIAYASIGHLNMEYYRNSVDAFTEALKPWSTDGLSEENSSGLLLFHIAKSYSSLGDNEMAGSYLKQCIAVSRDIHVVISAKLLLADIYKILGDYSSAQGLLQDILTEGPESAELHYLLGEIYFLQGENVRARSEWRLALNMDPAHSKARARLAL